MEVRQLQRAPRHEKLRAMKAAVGRYQPSIAYARMTSYAQTLRGAVSLNLASNIRKKPFSKRNGAKEI